MQILHGTWIPDATAAFKQTGGFYLWAESAVVHGRGRRAATLPPKELAALLGGELGLDEGDRVRRLLVERTLLLPHQDGRLLASPDLARLADLPVPEPDAAVELRPVELSCYPLWEPLSGLKELRFAAGYRVPELRLGDDLRFWHWVSRQLARVLARDRYIPALKYQVLSKTGRGRKGAAVEIHGGWEIVADDYETAVAQAAAAMPGVCGAGAGEGGLYEGEALVRHFCECQLAAAVARTPLPAAALRQVNYTVLGHCYRPPDQEQARSSDWLEARYRGWLRWRRALAGHRGGGGFQVGFRLVEPAAEASPWTLELLAVSRADPSLRPTLAEYWADAGTRALVRRQGGAGFEKQLLTDLGHAARMVPRLWDGLDTDRPQAIALDLEDAYAFLHEHAWVLQEAGFKVMVPAWWTPEGRRRARLRLKATGPAQAAAGAGGYFSLDALIRYRYELAIGGEAVSEQEWRQLVAAKSPLVRFRGQWLELDREQMQRLLAFWQTHGGEEARISLGELLRTAAAGEDEVDASHDAALDGLLRALRQPGRLEPAQDPPGFRGALRDYQKRGLAWIAYLEALGLNGCLADDMGLGKTVQVLARLLQARDGGPTLLIAPTSVLGNWQRESARFAPDLQTLVHHGPARPADAESFAAACRDRDLVITSFALARLDAKLLHTVDWRRVVVDEAQNIKNPKTAQTRAILKLRSPHRLALTGTPVENRLLDLWSIFNFLNPGYLGNQTRFRKSFELPVQRDQDTRRAEVLRELVQPFILRRVKTDKAIIADLPDKVENRQYCNLTREQASLYEAVVEDIEREIEQAEGMRRRGLILAALLRLKQICNHPAQFLQDGSAFDPDRSHKLERFLEMLDEVIQEGESLLVFSQFTEIGAALEGLLRARYRTYYLHGGTGRERRERMIAEFQDPDGEPAVFVLSLKAGGTGITLTRANHVFHFDRWWNPAVEDQATDRAYRIGQRRQVFVHKFVTLGTLEERIDRMIEDKKAIAGRIVGADESWLTELDNDRFKALVRLNRDAVLD